MYPKTALVSPCVTYELDALRAAVAYESRWRIHLRPYRMLPDRNPSRQRRPARIVAEGILTVGGAFQCVVCVLREAGRTRIQLSEGRDLDTGRADLLHSPGIAAAAFRAMATAHLAAKGRLYARTAGRN